MNQNTTQSSAHKRKQLCLRMNEEAILKLKYVAKQEGRSINGQIRWFVNTYIDFFEREHGKIKLAEDD